MACKKGQMKRFWSDDEKRSICAQMTVPGVSVAQVARRYAMNANLIHNWMKDPRFTPEPDINAVVDTDTGFLPVEIAGAVTVPFVDEAPQLDVTVSVERVDITFSDDRRILVEGPTALSGVLALTNSTYSFGWKRQKQLPPGSPHLKRR